MKEAKMDNREIDKLIHTKVMGLNGIASRYTEDICYAWQVVERLKETWGGIYLENEYGEWICSNADGYTRGAFVGRTVQVRAETAPLAVCLAALKCVGVEVAP